MKVEFRIGDAFPMDDPVARWLTALAISHNDLRDGTLRMVHAPEDAASERIYFLRLVASHFYEIASDLRRDPDEWAEVKAFIAALPEGARRDLDKARDIADELDRRLGIVRNTAAFHYPELDRREAAKGREKLQNALKEAANNTGAITLGDEFQDARFDFADEVIVQFFGDEAETELLMQQLREGVVTLWRFIHHAFNAKLEQLRKDGIARVA
jgi:hypothetical protein